MLAPWGSQLLSKGRNSGQGALGVSEAGPQVLPAALLGGGISEQKGGVVNKADSRYFSGTLFAFSMIQWMLAI